MMHCKQHHWNVINSLVSGESRRLEREMGPVYTPALPNKPHVNGLLLLAVFEIEARRQRWSISASQSGAASVGLYQGVGRAAMRAEIKTHESSNSFNVRRLFKIQLLLSFRNGSAQGVFQSTYRGLSVSCLLKVSVALLRLNILDREEIMLCSICLLILALCQVVTPSDHVCEDVRCNELAEQIETGINHEVSATMSQHGLQDGHGKIWRSFDCSLSIF